MTTKEIFSIKIRIPLRDWKTNAIWEEYIGTPEVYVDVLLTGW